MKRKDILEIKKRKLQKKLLQYLDNNYLLYHNKCERILIFT